MAMAAKQFAYIEHFIGPFPMRPSHVGKVKCWVPDYRHANVAEYVAYVVDECEAQANVAEYVAYVVDECEAQAYRPMGIDDDWH